MIDFLFSLVQVLGFYFVVCATLILTLKLAFWLIGEWPE